MSFARILISAAAPGRQPRDADSFANKGLGVLRQFPTARLTRCLLSSIFASRCIPAIALRPRVAMAASRHGGQASPQPRIMRPESAYTGGGGAGGSSSPSSSLSVGGGGMAGGIPPSRFSVWTGVGVGEVTGAVVGMGVGEVTGAVVGMGVGEVTGAVVGMGVGEVTGAVVGIGVGEVTGAVVGMGVGLAAVGAVVGIGVGADVGVASLA